jgi:hypothetical protein
VNPLISLQGKVSEGNDATRAFARGRTVGVFEVENWKAERDAGANIRQGQSFPEPFVDREGLSICFGTRGKSKRMI